MRTKILFISKYGDEKCHYPALNYYIFSNLLNMVSQILGCLNPQLLFMSALDYEFLGVKTLGSCVERRHETLEG